MLLSIVIVNWNTRDLLARCLSSVEVAMQSCGDSGVEVIVVDNGSQDSSAEMVQADFPWVVLLRNRDNIGFAAANNQALAACGGEFVLLLNSDTVVAERTFRILLDFIFTRPSAGACGPTLVNADGSFQASFADFISLRSEALHQLPLVSKLFNRYHPSHGPADSRQSAAVDWVGGACMLVRRACIDEVGILDESYVMYGEEMDWCFRMKRAGWTVWYCPDVSVVHLGGQSAKAVAEWKFVQIQKGKVRFVRKHYGPVQAWLLSAVIRCASLLKAGTLVVVACGVGSASRPVVLSRIRAYWSAVAAPL